MRTFYETHSEAETMAFAAALADMLSAGDTVLLQGDLGAGKSVVARGILRALGVQGLIPSPTFTLLLAYEAQKKAYHFDLYRLADPDEFYAAGLDEFIGGDGIALVEWPQMAQINPFPSLTLWLDRGSGDDDRQICVEDEGIRNFDAEKLVQWRKNG